MFVKRCQNSVIKIGCEVNIRSIHEEDSNIFVGSFITWCKGNCDDLFLLLYFVVISFLHQLLDFALTSPRSTTKKGLFCTAGSRFSSMFSLKESIDLSINLDTYAMQSSYKVCHLPLAQTSHTRLKYRLFLKANNFYSKYKHLRVFYLTDDPNALNYILEFPNCYHYVRYLSQDMFPINKLYQTYEFR